MNDIVDMSQFVEAKSDQLNADDLIGGPRTVTITSVVGTGGDQPVSIHYQGDNGKPFKPCKTIRRVMIAVWGRYANEYVGKSMTLYRDPKVTFGGLETGGIRISHMSGIEKETTVVVMKTKGKKAGMKILPLRDAPREQQAKQDSGPDQVTQWVRDLIARINAAPDRPAVDAILAEPMVAKRRPWLKTERPQLSADLETAITNFADDPFAEGRSDEQHGDQFPGDEPANQED